MSTLQRGSRGQPVADWQAFLVKRGWLLSAADGIFGAQTVHGTQRFQSSRRLAADGVVGPATVQAARQLGFQDALPASSAPEPPRIQPSTASNDFFPPKPSFPPLVSDADRRTLFGNFAFTPAPTPSNPEAIKLTDGWASANIVSVTVPGLAGKPLGGLQATSRGKLSFHRKAATQLVGLWQAWGEAGLLDRILTFDGAYNPRFQRGSHTRLSNHAFGTAFDLNAQYNPFRKPVAASGKKGCLLELVALANQHGFYWGGHFAPTTDGMHFEVAQLL
jgi:hypothetical protein